MGPGFYEQLESGNGQQGEVDKQIRDDQPIGWPWNPEPTFGQAKTFSMAAEPQLIDMTPPRTNAGTIQMDDIEREMFGLRKDEQPLPFYAVPKFPIGTTDDQNDGLGKWWQKKETPAPLPTGPKIKTFADIASNGHMETMHDNGNGTFTIIGMGGTIKSTDTENGKPFECEKCKNVVDQSYMKRCSGCDKNGLCNECNTCSTCDAKLRAMVDNSRGSMNKENESVPSLNLTGMRGTPPRGIACNLYSEVIFFRK